MATNFENVEIKDAASVPRKIAGDYETQGAESLFHQTSRNLNTVLEEVTGVTLASATNLDIPLNGMESHVIVDLRSKMDNPVVMQLQYTTGGPFYAADWERMSPVRTTPGIRNQGDDYNLSGGVQSPGVEDSDSKAGTHVFAIPTNGAVALRLSLYGSSVTKAGVAWKRVVLASPGVQHSITRSVRSMRSSDASMNPAAQPYTTGQFLGTPQWLSVYANTDGEALMFLTLRGIRMSTDLNVGDFDLLLVTEDFTATDKAAFTFVDAYKIRAIYEFRVDPGVGQYKLHAAAGGSFAQVQDINFVINEKYNAVESPFLKMIGVARGALTANGYISFDFLFEF